MAKEVFLERRAILSALLLISVLVYFAFEGDYSITYQSAFLDFMIIGALTIKIIVNKDYLIRLIQADIILI